MTSRSRYVGGVELAVAELQKPFGIDADLSPFVISLEGVRRLRAFYARSDKTSLSGPFEPKQGFAAVRMLARRAHPTATFIATAISTQTSITNTTFTGSQNDEGRQRHYSLPARHSFGQPSHHRTSTNAKYAEDDGRASPAA